MVLRSKLKVEMAELISRSGGESLKACDEQNGIPLP